MNWSRYTQVRIEGLYQSSQFANMLLGATVGAYATSNGRYGERAFAAYVSKWRYEGLEQIRQQP